MQTVFGSFCPQVLRDALHCARPITVRLLNYRADGTPFVNDLTILPIIDPAMQVTTHFLGVVRDRPLSGRRQLVSIPERKSLSILLTPGHRALRCR